MNPVDPRTRGVFSVYSARACPATVVGQTLGRGVTVPGRKVAGLVGEVTGLVRRSGRPVERSPGPVGSPTPAGRSPGQPVRRLPLGTRDEGRQGGLAAPRVVGLGTMAGYGGQCMQRALGSGMSVKAARLGGSFSGADPGSSRVKPTPLDEDFGLWTLPTCAAIRYRDPDLGHMLHLSRYGHPPGPMRRETSTRRRRRRTMRGTEGASWRPAA